MDPRLSSGAEPQPAEPAAPSRSEMGGWYDAPSNSEMVAGELAPEHGAPAPGLQYQSDSPPGQDGAVAAPDTGAELVLRQVRDYQPLNLPEGAVGNDAKFREMFGILDAQDMDHQSRAQRLADLHFSAAKDIADEYGKNQRKVWADLNNRWLDQVRNDPEIGGGKLDSSLQRAKAVINEFTTAGAQRNDLMGWLGSSGMGNHPEVIRMLNRIGEKLNVFETGVNTGQVRPPGNLNARPGGRGWYPEMGR
jgi:hypothetical protein